VHLCLVQCVIYKVCRFLVDSLEYKLQKEATRHYECQPTLLARRLVRRSFSEDGNSAEESISKSS